jgi:beta-phosphoglucomutase-like phosphatase (HAD superfamily)
MPGAIELLKQLKEFNAVCAIYTGNTDNFIKILIEKLIKPHIPDFDSFIPDTNRVYGNNLPENLTKSDPYACRLLCKILGVAPEESVMFEDRPSGVASAARAGYPSIVVPEGQDIRPFTNPEEMLSIPRLVQETKSASGVLDPNRFQILPGLDRICLIGPDGQERFPEAYYKQKKHWISLKR